MPKQQLLKTFFKLLQWIFLPLAASSKSLRQRTREKNWKSFFKYCLTMILARWQSSKVQSSNFFYDEQSWKYNIRTFFHAISNLCTFCIVWFTNYFKFCQFELCHYQVLRLSIPSSNFVTPKFELCHYRVRTLEFRTLYLVSMILVWLHALNFFRKAEKV